MPATLGQGFVAIQDQVATATHMHGTKSYDVGHVSRNLSEYCGFCSDLGTEAKIIYFRLQVGKLNNVMPFWAAGRVNRVPMVESVEGEEGCAGSVNRA